MNKKVLKEWNRQMLLVKNRMDLMDSEFDYTELADAYYAVMASFERLSLICENILAEEE